MRSRTDSESVRTSRPSTRASPPLRGKRPVSILMTVVLPLPLGPRKPKISPFSTRKLTSLTAVKLPKRRTRFCAEMAASAELFLPLGIDSTSFFEFHIGSHAGQHVAAGIIDANLYAENLVHAFLTGLDVARQEFSLLVNLFEDPFEYCFRKGVDSDFGLLPELEAAIFGFGNVDAYVDLVFFEKSGDRVFGSNEFPRAHVENFDDGGGGSRDLALTEAGFVVGIGCSCEVDVFATVPTLELFQVGLCLMIVCFPSSDFLGTVAALQLIELVAGGLCWVVSAVY